MSIVTRQGKGSRLTVEEMDGNFTYLEELASQAVLGATGPQGPTGATGPQGVTGPAGEFNITYKVYNALLTQSGTASPTVTVLADDFGYEWNFVRIDEGNYQIQDFINNPFTDNKTIGFITLSGGGNNKIVNFTQAFSAIVQFAVIDPTTAAFVDLNGSAQIEIRVYN